MPVHDYEDRFNLDDSVRGGDPSAFSLRIGRILVQESYPIDLPTSGVTLIVGGNNSGKSTLLRQMHSWITQPSSGSHVSLQPPLLVEQTVELSGTQADTHAWFAENAHAGERGYERRGFRISVSQIHLAHTEKLGHYDTLGQAVTLAPNARSRFSATSPTERRKDFTSPPSHDLHYFENDMALQEELSEYSLQIFGTGVTLDPLSGSLMFRFGKPTLEAPPVTQISPAFRDDLGRLSPIDNQGDGVASTLGLLIPLIAGRNQISFVDEPEAYLHPPQAYRLGQAVAKITANQKGQLIVATHDRNFVAGVLSAQDSETTVVRLERTLDRTEAFKVDPEELQRIQVSALLRHSNVLDGLFHRVAMIAENARDCLFYAAALEEAGPLPDNLLANDILFISANGKGGTAEIAEILRAAHVPVLAVLDMDAINDRSFLQRTLKALGGAWSDEIEGSYVKATAEFQQARRSLTNQMIKTLIVNELDKDPEAPYTGAVRTSVMRILAADNPWSAIKDHGINGFRAERRAAETMVSLLADQGIVLVPVGELEGFAPRLHVPKGRKWLPAALEAGVHRDDTARKFALTLAQTAIERSSPSSPLP